MKEAPANPLLQKPKGPCKLWTGAGSNPDTKRTQKNGLIRRYDKYRGKSVSKTPARYFYEQRHGVLRSGIEVFHICQQPLCINLDHLIAGTRSILYRWAAEAGRIHRPPRKTHCPHGHELSGENLYIWTSPSTGKTRRMCKTCRNTKANAYVRARDGFKPRQKREHPKLHTPKLRLKLFEVVPLEDGGWNVIHRGVVLTTQWYKADAYKEARTIAAEKAPSKLNIYNREGNIINTYRYGVPREICKRGHPYTEENTLVYWNKTTNSWYRNCKACTNKRNRVNWRKENGKGNTIAKYREEWVESYAPDEPPEESELQGLGYGGLG